MSRITRSSLSTGWCKKIRITLSTVASSVTYMFSVFLRFSDEPVTEDDSMFELARMNLSLRYENVEYGLKI